MLLVLAAVGMPLAAVQAANITVVAGLDAVRPLTLAPAASAGVDIVCAACSMRPDACDTAAVELGRLLPYDF